MRSRWDLLSGGLLGRREELFGRLHRTLLIPAVFVWLLSGGVTSVPGGESDSLNKPPQEQVKVVQPISKGLFTFGTSKHAIEEIESVTIRGRAINPQGEPIANAKMILGSSLHVESSLIAEVLTGEDGRFEISNAKLPVYRYLNEEEEERTFEEEKNRLPAYGEFQLVGKADGYGLAWRKPVRYYAAERSKVADEPESANVERAFRGEPIELELTFFPEARLSGRLQDEKGNPIPKISLEGSLMSEAMMPLLDTQEKDQGAGPLYAFMLLGQTEFKCESDDLGSYKMGGLPKDSIVILGLGESESDGIEEPIRIIRVGKPRVRAEHLANMISGFGGRSVKVIDLPEDGHLDLTFRSHQDVSVRIIDEATKAPISGVSVEAILKKNQFGLRRNITDQQGVARLSLPDGKYEFLCIPPAESEYLLRKGELTLKSEMERTARELTIELKSGVEVEFRAIDSETGMGVEGIRFQSYLEEEATNGKIFVPAPWTQYFGTRMTDKDGLLRVRLPAATCQFRPIVPEGFAKIVRRDIVEGGGDYTKISWNPSRAEEITLSPGKTTRLKFEMATEVEGDESTADPGIEEILKQLDRSQEKQRVLLTRYQARCRVMNVQYSKSGRVEIQQSLKTMSSLNREQCRKELKRLFSDSSQYETTLTTVDGMWMRYEKYSPTYNIRGNGAEGLPEISVNNGWEYAHQFGPHSKQTSIQSANDGTGTRLGLISQTQRSRLPRRIQLDSYDDAMHTPVSVEKEGDRFTVKGEVQGSKKEGTGNFLRKQSMEFDEGGEFISHSVETTGSMEEEEQNLLESFFVSAKAKGVTRTTEFWRYFPKRYPNGVVLPELIVRVEFQNDVLKNATVTIIDDVAFPETIPEGMFRLSMESGGYLMANRNRLQDDVLLLDISFSSGQEIHSIGFEVDDVVEYANRRGWGVIWP